MRGFGACSVVSFTVEKVVHNSSLKHLVGEHMGAMAAYLFRFRITLA